MEDQETDVEDEKSRLNTIQLGTAHSMGLRLGITTTRGRSNLIYECSRRSSVFCRSRRQLGSSKDRIPNPRIWGRIEELWGLDEQEYQQLWEPLQ